MHIKDANVTNPKNVVVQIPGFVADKWALKKNDVLEVCISGDGSEVIIRPKKIRARGDTDD